jgi:hypothetical protein
MTYKRTINIPETAFSVTRQGLDDFANELLHAAIIN